MKRKLTLLLTAVVALLAFTGTAATPPDAMAKTRVNHNTSSATSVYHKASSQATATFTPLRYVNADAKKPGIMVKAKSQSAAAKAVSAAPIAKADANATYPDLYASVTTYTTVARNSRIAKLSTAQDQAFVTKYDYVWANYGGVAFDHKYYYFCHQAVGSSSRFSNALWTVYTDNWSSGKRIASDDNLPIGLGASDVAYNPVDKKVYGCFLKEESEGTGYVFGTVDYDKVTRTKIADLPDQWNALAIDSKGTGYAIDMNGQLLKVDLSNGSTTVVGNTGLKPYYVSSATIDVKSDRMFYAVLTEDSKSSLYEINTATAAATFIVSYDDNTQICGMFIPTPIAEDHAPASATGLSVNFPNGSLSGTVSFVVPATYYNGDAATGTVNYVVSSSISDTVKGTAAYGEQVSVPITVRERGYVAFNVALSNEVGSAPVATSGKFFIGSAAPDAPTKITLVTSGDTAKLSWQASEGADRYYFDADSIRYTVLRMPAGVQVYDGYDTNFSEKIEAGGNFTKVYYNVKATTRNGLESKYGSSNGVAFGTIVPPYKETFDGSGDAAGYTIIDANNDKRTWAYFASTASMRATYSPKNKGDDWLITPPVQLKAGETYRFSFDAINKQRYNERFEVKAGTAPTVEGMTVALVDTVTLDAFSTSSPSAFFKAPADGIYYFGIHYVSDANMFGLYADNIEISAGIPGEAPDSVGVPVVEHDATGAVAVNVKFTAPVKNLKGDAISKVDSIVVAKDGVLLKQFGSMAAGQECTFTDTDEKDGAHNYTFTSYLNGNAGIPATFNIFVGIGVPDTVRNLNINEDKSALGTVNISWEAPAADVNGSKLNSSVYNYTVTVYDYEGNETVVADSISGEKFTYKATDGEQKFVAYSVYANDRVGRSAGVTTDVIAVGNPDKIPYAESFAGAMTSHPWAAEAIVGNSYYVWALGNDASISDFTSYDHDNGYAVFFGFDTFVSSFTTGKIDLSGLKKPTLTFYNYNIDVDDVNVLDVQISTDGKGKSWTTLKSFVENSLPHTGWNRISIPLDSYAGKEVQLRWVGHLNLYTHMFLDNVKIDEAVSCDVAATGISAPSKAEAGEEFDVAVTVENNALAAVNNVKVTLYCNDKAIADSTLTTIAADDSKQVVFKHTFTNIDDATNTFYGLVSADGDQKADNNSTDTIEVIAKLPVLPTPTSLEGSANNDGSVSLKWTAPNLDNIVPAAYTETFESADTKDAFPTKFGDWTFVDVDQKPIGGPNTFSLPGIDYESRQSFFVMDASNAVFSNETLKALYAAKSGTKYLSNMYLYNEGVVNDWAISPVLSGIEQDISFYARCFTKAYPETFQVLYSTTDTEISSFKQIGEEVAIQTTDWTKFYFTLPEGAKYFAIRCTSNSAYSLFIDDVTYTPASDGQKGELEGYNVYRDGVKINTDLVSTTSFTDSQLPSGDEFTYVVTAVIKNRGESAASNKAVVKRVTGIDGTESYRTVVSVDYYDTLGRKVTEPAAGTVVVERTVYDDGTSATTKKIVK